MSICFDNEEVTSDHGWSCVGKNWGRSETQVEVRTGGSDVKTGVDGGCSEHLSQRVATRGGM